MKINEFSLDCLRTCYYLIWLYLIVLGDKVSIWVLVKFYNIRRILQMFFSNQEIYIYLLFRLN